MAIALGTYKSSYYIKPSQVTLMANDQNNPSLVYVGVRSGTYVEIYYTDQTGATPEQVIGYGPNSSYQKWQLSGSSTKLASNAKHYIYIRLRRTEKTAMLIFSTRLYDFYGENPDGVNHAANRNLYYYILVGELTATDGTSQRELTFQTGSLSTPENSYNKEEADSKFMSFEIADQRYLNQVEDDTAKGIITFLQGIKIGSWEGENTAHSFQLRYDETLDSVVLSRTDGKPAHFLATGALSTRGLGNTEEGGTGGGMDHVYNVDDFSKALDSFNKVSETDTFNAYAIRSLYEMVKNIENSSTDTSYVDGKIEDVNKKIDTNTAYLSEWIRRTEETLQGNIDAVESALQENIDTVAGDLSTLQTTVNDFLTGTDTDTIINRWKELEAFLNGYTETSTLADLLSGKADKATTLAGYGITNAYTKTEVDSKITSVNTSVTTLQTTVSGHTTSINSLQTTVSGHTSSITSINSKITTLQGYFTDGVAKSALRLSDGTEYKAWGQVFFKDGKPVNVSGAATFTQVNADSVLFGGKARLAYDSTLNALLLTKDDGTVVHFLASGAVATRGLGELDESGGGTGTGVDLLNVPSDIIPSVGNTYSLGTSGKSWKELFVGDIQSGNIMPSSHYTYSLGADDNRWSKIYAVDIYATRFTMNGEPVATRNWVNSQSFAKASDLTSINNSITALQASTFTGANAPEGYTLTWFTQSGGARNVTIPAYGEVGTVATDGLAGIGQNVALVDQWLISDLISYINDAVTGGSVDLTSVASDIIPDGNLTRKLGSSSNRWSSLYVNSIIAGTIAPRTDNGWDLGMTTFRWRNLYAVDGHFDNLSVGGYTINVTTSVASGNTSLVTSGGVYTALQNNVVSGGKLNLSSITTTELASIMSSLGDNGIKFYIVTDSSGNIPSLKGETSITVSDTAKLLLFGKSSPFGVNVGDILAVTKLTCKIIPLNDAKAASGDFPGADGLETVWDKTQINKIAGIESTANAALPRVSALPSKWESNMNNALETGVYVWCTLGRPAGSTGAYTCVVLRTSTNDGNYDTIEQTAYGREAELGQVYKRIIFYKSDGTDTQYGEWRRVDRPNDYITLNSAQTISGKKTFTGGIAVNNGITASHLYSVEYLDSSALTINAEEVTFTYGGDNANILVGLINGYKPLTLGNTSFSPALSSGTVIGTITIGGESKTIYAPRGESVDLSNYVTLDSEQTITGRKTFTDINVNSIYLQGFELTPYNPDGGTPDRLMYDGYVLLDEYNYSEYLDSAYIKKSGGTVLGKLGFSGGTYPQIYGDGNYLSLSPASDGLYGLTFDKSNTAIRARGNNNTRLGISGYRWSNVYSVLGNFSGQITSSVVDGTAPFVVASKTEVANLNAMYHGGLAMLSIGFPYKSKETITDTTNAIWYAKVTFKTGWNHNLHKIYIEANYNNINGKVLLDVDGYSHSYGNYTVKSSNYNGNNVIGFHWGLTSDNINVLYLKLRGSSSATTTVYSTLEINTIEVVDAESVPTLISLSSNGGEIWTNYNINANAATATYATSAGNADKLDGYHESSFFRYRGSADAANVNCDDVEGFGMYSIGDVDVSNTGYPTPNGNMLNFRASTGLFQILSNYSGGSVWIRSRWYNNETAWRKIAYTSSNVASATKLATARTLWGQPFDGSANVSGNLTDVRNITGIAGISINTTGLNGILLRYNSNNATSVALYSTAFRPLDEANGLLDLGSTSARWKGIYGQTLDLTGSVSLGTADTSIGYKQGGHVVIRGTETGTIIAANGGNMLFRPIGNTSISGQMSLLSSGNLKIGYNGGLTDNGYRLDVNGTFHASGNATIGGSIDVTGKFTGDVANLNRLHLAQSATETDAGTAKGICFINNWDDGAADDNGVIRPWYGITIDRTSNNFNQLMISNYNGMTFRTGANNKGFVFKGGNVLPYSNGGQSLGDNNHYWNEVYINTVRATKLFIGDATIDGTLTVNGVGITGATTDGVNQLTIDGEIHSDYICWFDEIEVATGIGSDKWSIYDGEASFTSIQSGNVLPKSNGSGNVGSSSLKWLNGYFNSLYSDAISVETLIPRNSPYISVNAMSLDLYECELYGYNSDNLDVWNIDFAGNAYFQSVTQSSDIRYKNIKENVHLKLSDIAAAPTFKFSWANETDGSTHLGTSAQYWQGIAGELVVANKKTGKLGLDYSTAALVSAISIAREVNTIKMWQTTTTDRIGELEDKVKKLEEENKVLREMLNNNN